METDVDTLVDFTFARLAHAALADIGGRQARDPGSPSPRSHRLNIRLSGTRDQAYFLDAAALQRRTRLKQRVVIMLSFMLSMHPNPCVNPHHSIAILTSERANISDPRVRALADKIIKSQREEISQMKALVDELGRQR